MIASLTDGRMATIHAGTVHTFQKDTDPLGLELWDALQTDAITSTSHSPVVVPCMEPYKDEGGVLVLGASYPEQPLVHFYLGKFITIQVQGGYL